MGLTHAQRRVGVTLIAAVVALAAPSSAAAYRTLADDPALATSVPPRHAATVRWQLAAGALPVSDVVLVEDAALASFDAWRAPDCSAVETEYRGLSGGTAVAGDGISTIELVTSRWADRGLSDDRPAITDVQLRETATGWEIAEADVYLDFTRHSWSFFGEEGALDVRGVLTHEVGHVLGLLHPCEESTSDAPLCGGGTYGPSAMYPTYLGSTQRALASDDIAGICAIYPSPVCDPECDEDHRCVDGTCVACERPGCAPDPCAFGCSTEPMMCLSDDECSGGQCAIGGPDEGLCVAAGARGAECMQGADCESRLCVSSLVHGSYCTRSCRRDGECASSEQCTEIGGRRVCAPRPASSTCAVGGRRGGLGRPGALFMILVATGALGATRRAADRRRQRVVE